MKILKNIITNNKFYIYIRYIITKKNNNKYDDINSCFFKTFFLIRFFVVLICIYFSD